MKQFLFEMYNILLTINFIINNLHQSPLGLVSLSILFEILSNLFFVMHLTRGQKYNNISMHNNNMNHIGAYPVSDIGRSRCVGIGTYIILY